MSKGIAVAAALAATLAAEGARADTDYFTAKQSPVVVTTGNDRTSHQRLVLGALAAGVVVFGAAGGYYNWKSHDDADQVSATAPTGKVWSSDLQATYDRAHTDGVVAGVCYGVGAAFLAATIYYAVHTDPGSRQVELPTTGPQASISPVPGGAIVGATWGF